MNNRILRCLIVEDEPLAADILKDYVSQIPFLELAGICYTSSQALAWLNKESVDLLFLDIHLPGLKGLDFLETLPSPPKTIITTAYHEYALKSYEHSVIDYLLKPIEFKRFVQAVNKAQYADHFPKAGKLLTIHSDKKTVLIPEEEILYVESQKEYIHIHTPSKVHIAKIALSKMEEQLPSYLFLRIHRSFIISFRYIQAYNLQEIELAGKRIPIGGNYRELIAEKLKQYFRQG